MKKTYQELGRYIPAPQGSVNLAMNQNHHIDWNEHLMIDWQKLHSEYDYGPYGDGEYLNLKKAYANYAGVQINNLIVTAGSEPLIGLLFQSLIEKNIMLADPDFFRFDEFAHICELNVIKTPIRQGMDIPKTIQMINEEQVELFIFSNPNNPLGTKETNDAIIQLLEETECYIVVDEAYGEFSDGTAVRLVEQYPKLIVLRTLSKAWGLAGLRIGFGIAQPQLIEFLEVALGPFNLSTLITEIAAAAVSQKTYMQTVLGEIIALRDEWHTKLEQKYQFKVYPTHTNFINIELAASEELWQFLKDRNIRVSKFQPCNLRISIGAPEEMAQLEVALDAFVLMRAPR